MTSSGLAWCRASAPRRVRRLRWPSLAVGAGQEQVQGGQVRQDAVLADERVPRPFGSGALALVLPWRQR